MTRPTLKVEFYNAGFTDYATLTRRITIRRGRQRLLERHQSASCTIELDAPNTGTPVGAYLDPASGSGLYGPDTFVVVSCTSPATRRLFAGWVDEWQVAYPGDDFARVTVTASGPFKKLSQVAFPTDTFDNTSATDVDTLLDAFVAYAIGGGADLGTWVLSSDGSGGQAKEINATGDTLSVCQQLAVDQADGDFFEEFTNDQTHPIFRFVARSRRFHPSGFTFTDVSPSPTTSFPYNESALYSRTTDDFIRNSVTVTRNGGTAQTATDSTSIASHFIRELSRSTFHTGDAEASVLAQDLVAAFKEPPTAEWAQIQLEPDAEDDSDLWALVVDVGYESASSNGPRISDRVTVTRTTPFATSTRQCIVTGYQHDIAPIAEGGWVTTLFLADAEATKSALILDDATAGKLDTGRLG